MLYELLPRVLGLLDRLVFDEDVAQPLHSLLHLLQVDLHGAGNDHLDHVAVSLCHISHVLHDFSVFFVDRQLLDSDHMLQDNHS